MEYRREVGIPFNAAEFEVTIIVDNMGYEGLLHVSRSGNGALHPMEILYFPDGIVKTAPIKPHQKGNVSWDANFGNPTYIKRITFEEYNESEIPEARADDFSRALEKMTYGRIIIR